MYPIIVMGLGNPGDSYQWTRHNVGFHVIDELAGFFGLSCKKRKFIPLAAAELSQEGGKVLLAKPLSFMNNSGQVIKHLAKLAGTSSDSEQGARLVVICDNVDLETGVVRIRKEGGAGGHNGMRSILQNKGSLQLIKVYIGVGKNKGALDKYVLSRPKGDDMEAMKVGIAVARDVLIRIIRGEDLEKIIGDLHAGQ